MTEPDESESLVMIQREVYTKQSLNKQFQYQENFTPLRKRLKSAFQNQCSCSKNRLKNFFAAFLPVIYWLPRYKRKNIFGDLVAGLTVGIMHIPQGMGYASLAGLDAVYGLYTSFFASLIYAFFGTSYHVSIGTFAVASLMVGQVRYRYCPEQLIESNATSMLNGTLNGTCIYPNLTPVDVVCSLTFLVGLVQLILAFLKLGFLSVFLSDQLVNGFTTGAAVMVFTAQVDKALGVKLPRHADFGKLYFTYRDLIFSLPSVNIATLVMSIVCIIVIYLVKEYVTPWFKRKTRIPFPIDLVVIIVATMLSHFFHFKRRWNVKIVNQIPTGLPMPELPRLGLLPGMMGDAISIAVVDFAQTVSMAQIFAKRHKYKIEANQELYALGMVQFLGSFVDSYAAGASLSRSSVNESAGSRSQLSSVIACLVVLIVLLFIGPLFQELPMCALAAIIMVALKGLFMQLKELKTLWPISKIDFSIWLVSFLATCICDVTYGLVISVLFSLGTLIFRTYRINGANLGRLGSTEFFQDEERYSSAKTYKNLKIYRCGGPLFYANASTFRDDLYKFCGIDIVAALATLEARKVKKAKKTQPKASGCFARFRRESSFFRKKKLPVTYTGANDIKPDESADEFSQTGRELSDDTLSALTEVLNKDGTKTSGRPTRRILPEAIIIDCSAVTYVDMSALEILKQCFLPITVTQPDSKGGMFYARTVWKEVTDVGIDLSLAALQDPVVQFLQASGFLTRFPESSVFPSVLDAIVQVTSVFEETNFPSGATLVQQQSHLSQSNQCDVA